MVPHVGGETKDRWLINKPNGDSIVYYKRITLSELGGALKVPLRILAQSIFFTLQVILSVLLERGTQIQLIYCLSKCVMQAT